MNEQVEISKIKLIIWDLDETFWDGILSDNTADLCDINVQLIKNMTDAGVINSICSKNDFEEVKKYMSSFGLWDYFVFTSINWSAKGERVKQIIQEMNLREVNVLFIDDNHLNLKEVKNVCPNIMISTPNIIPTLIAHFNKAPKKDINHSRLDQYKVLERKKNFKAQTSSNEEFLIQCGIEVEINKNCLEKVERIADLVLRSNQLNFTKLRNTQEELVILLQKDSVDAGYVSVHDKFGDYGIVGFYAFEAGKLVHFVFSCRTLNMGIEQYVYHQLGCPQIEIIGEVASSLSDPCPYWINKKGSANRVVKSKIENKKFLIKGPCDLELVFSFIDGGKNIIKEFVYVGKNGISVEGGCHTSHIVQSLTIKEAGCKKMCEKLPFADADMFRTRMFDEGIGAIYLSLFTDPNLGLYREKSGGITVAFGEWTNDLTDEKLWPQLIAQELFTANCSFSEKSLQFIKKNYEFLGRIKPKETIENLDVIYQHLSKDTKLILNLGSEIEYFGNTKEAYQDRHLYHKRLNDLVKEWANDKENVYLIETTKYITSQETYTNNINHFSKETYKRIADDIIKIVNSDAIKTRKRQQSPLVRKLRKAWNLLCLKMNVKMRQKVSETNNNTEE